MSDKDNLSSSSDELAPAAGRKPVSLLKVLLLIVLGVGAGYYLLARVPGEPVATAVAWQQDFDQASRQAKASGKVIFADFTAGWCTYCRKMDETVFSRQEFARSLEEVAVPLRVDVDSHEGASLAQRYGIDGIPAYRVLRPDGRAIGKGEGAATAESLLKLVRQAAEQAKVAIP